MASWKDYAEAESIEKVVATDRAPMFKVEEHKTFRVGFPLVNPEKGSVSLIPVKYYEYTYKTQEGKDAFTNIKEPSDPEMIKKLKARFGEPKVRWVTVLFQYDTSVEGKCYKPFVGSLVGVRLSAKEVQFLKSINMSSKLMVTDCYVTTDNPKYQSKQFAAIVKAGEPQSALWLKDKVHKRSDDDDGEDMNAGEIWDHDAIIEEAWSMLDSVLANVVSEASEDLINRALGIKQSSQSFAQPANDDEDWDEGDAPAQPAAAKKANDIEIEEPDDFE